MRPVSPAVRLAPRRWWRIMPLVFVTYSLAYVDRANFGLAAAAGMAKDLKITQGLSSLIGSLFLLGYCAFQIPGAIYAEKYSVRKLIIVSMIAWGLCSAATGVVSDVTTLLAIRFLMGVAEAAVMPAILIYIANWFSRPERAMANTLFILGNPVAVLWMSILSGYLIQTLNWRWMFVLEGLPAVVWAIVAWLPAVEQPSQARWLSATEKSELEKALASEESKTMVIRNYRELFKSPQLLCLCLQYGCWSAGVFGFVLWLPSMIKNGASGGIVSTGWLSAVPYFVAIIAMLTVSYVSRASCHRKAYVWSCLLIAALAFFGLYVSWSRSYWFSYGLLILAGASMYAPYGAYWALVTELIPKNVRGSAMALVNSAGALGGFFGSYLIGYFNDPETGPGVSFLLLAVALVVAATAMAWINRDPSKQSAKRGTSTTPHESIFRRNT